MKTSRYVVHALFVFGLWLGMGLQAHGQTRTVHYYYTDPQGTPLVKTDAQGNVIARYDYTPYGNAVTSLGSPPNGPGYTGHVNDPETGLVYMQARYYQPDGRFLSPDPMEPTAGNVFSFNRYAYGNGNPISNTDPTGMQDCSDQCLRMRALSDHFTSMASSAYRENSSARVHAHTDAGSHRTYNQGAAAETSDVTDTVIGDDNSDAEGDATAVPVTYQGYYHDELVRKLAAGMNASGANVLTEVKMCLEITCARIDLLGLTPAGTLFGMEVKTGSRPKFTPEQLAVYLHMRAGNVLVSPDNKIRQLGLVPGLPLPSIDGKVLYQRDASSPPFVGPIP